MKALGILDHVADASHSHVATYDLCTTHAHGHQASLPLLPVDARELCCGERPPLIKGSQKCSSTYLHLGLRPLSRLSGSRFFH